MPTVYKRIMSILHKIFILIMVYEVFSILHGGILLCTSKWFILVTARKIVSISVCYSMYLMMDHNKEQYIKFL